MVYSGGGNITFEDYLKYNKKPTAVAKGDIIRTTIEVTIDIPAEKYLDKLSELNSDTIGEVVDTEVSKLLKEKLPDYKTDWYGSWEYIEKK